MIGFKLLDLPVLLILSYVQNELSLKKIYLISDKSYQCKVTRFFVRWISIFIREKEG